MGNTRWWVGGGTAALVVMGGAIALGVTSTAGAPAPSPSAASTEERVANCMEWRTYALATGLEPLQADEDDCQAAVLEDASVFTAPPTSDEWGDATS